MQALTQEADERLLIEAAQKDPARFAELYERNFNPPLGGSSGTLNTTAPGAATWKVQGQPEVYFEALQPGTGQRERVSNTVALR